MAGFVCVDGVWFDLTWGWVMILVVQLVVVANSVVFIALVCCLCNSFRRVVSVQEEEK